MKGFEIVRKMFCELDLDNSDDITYDELKNAFTNLGDSKLCDQRMAELDFNQDMRIDYMEFCVGISIWVGFIDDDDE